MTFKKLYLTIITITLISYSKTIKETPSSSCTITSSSPINPYPNLKKCYKYKDLSCCNIMNDEYIREKTLEIIPESCLRKYPELEDLLCLSCSPYEGNYITKQTETSSVKTINICQSFAEKLWNVTKEGTITLTTSTNRFDGCGFLTINSGISSRVSSGQSFIYPSQIFTSFNDFITTIGIPYYDSSSYVFEVIEGNGTNCFNFDYKVKYGFFTFLITIFGIFF